MKKFIIIVLVVLIVVVIGLTARINLSHRWKVKPYKRIYVEIPENLAENVSRNDLKSLVDNLFDQPHFYREKSNFTQYGKTIILFRSVTINAKLDNENYTLTYAHELTHLKYMCANETFTAYKTFVALYESGNEILKNVAERYACKVLRGDWQGTPYDIGYYILEYFKENGYEK